MTFQEVVYPGHLIGELWASSTRPGLEEVAKEAVWHHIEAYGG